VLLELLRQRRLADKSDHLIDQLPILEEENRGNMLSEIVSSRATVVLFEAANRVASTLQALVEAGAGQRNAVVARELTKQFEEFKRGTVAHLADLYGAAHPKGEVVLMIGGAEDRAVTEAELEVAAKKLRAAGKSPRDVMDHLVVALGAPRNAAYRIAHQSES
jgi:16S rRNA (cytidine1402-2'-O)-methyltransferase